MVREPGRQFQHVVNELTTRNTSQAIKAGSNLDFMKLVKQINERSSFSFLLEKNSTVSNRNVHCCLCYKRVIVKCLSYC